MSTNTNNSEANPADDAAKPNTPKPKFVPDMSLIPTKASDLYLNDYEEIPEGGKCHEALIWFRKLTGAGSQYIEAIAQEAIVHRLVTLLSVSNNDKIQFESAWVLTNIASGTTENTNLVVKAKSIPAFVELLKSEVFDVRDQAVWGLGNIAGDSAIYRDMVIEAGALPLLVGIGSKETKATILRNTAWAISNCLRGKPQPSIEVLKETLPYLKVNIMESTDDEVLTDTLWALSYASDGDNARIQLVVDLDIAKRLVDLVMNPKLTAPALRTLGNIVTGNDIHTQYIVDAGVLAVFKVLLHHNKKSVVKETLWSISNITAGTASQIQSVLDANLLENVIDLCDSADYDVVKEAVWVLSNATMGGAMQQINYLVSLGYFQAICKVINRDETSILNPALESIENVLRSGMTYGDENEYSTYLDDNGGFERLEELAENENPTIGNKASQIIEDFFSAEGFDEQPIEWNKEDAVKELDKHFEKGTFYVRNKIINEELMDEMILFMEKMGVDLKKISFRNNNMNLDTVSKLLKFLEKNISITDIRLEKNLEDSCMDGFGKLISTNKSIQNISFGSFISGNGITDEGVKVLFPYLQGNTTLRSLSFRMNSGITNKSILLLTEIVNSSKIQSLNVEGTEISLKEDLVTPLAVNKIINGCSSVNVTSKPITDAQIPLLCDALKKEDRFLTRLILRENGLTSASASMIFDSLQNHDSLNLLDISKNKLDNACMEALGGLMKYNQSIETLNISNNFIKEEGFVALFDSLIGNKTLKTLNINENGNIGKDLLPLLKDMLQGSALQVLSMSFSQLGSEIEKEITDLLKRPLNQRDLPIESKSKSAAKTT